MIFKARITQINLFFSMKYMPKLYLLYFYTPSSWFQNIGVLKTVGLCSDLVFLFDEIRRIVYRVDHLPAC